MNVNELIDMLHEYQENELTEWGKMHLKDKLLDLSQQLNDEGINEGVRYDGMTLLVKHGDEIPQPYTEMTVESPLTNVKYTIHIKEITQLRFTEKGDLVVEVLAKRTKVTA